MIFNEVVLKVTNKCNLNCSYCYVFNQGDFSYKNEPSSIDPLIVHNLLEKINSYAKKNKLESFLIIFHGGEPLLAGKSFYKEFVKLASEVVVSTNMRFALQTNGTLLTKEWCELFKKLNIQIGVSIDGPETASINRVYKKDNEPAYSNIMRGINLVQESQMDVSSLSVVNVNVSPLEMYNFLKSTNISFLDLLFPDATYEKVGDSVGKIGHWLAEIFTLWYNDKDDKKPTIRTFDLLISLMLGNDVRGNEVFGARDNTSINIKSDGSIAPVDTLKICGDGFTKTQFNIVQNDFDDVVEHQLIKEYYYAHNESVLCQKCQECIINHICGGGQLSHRFSPKRRFENPSIYCEDIVNLVIRIQNTLFETISELRDCGVEALTIDDFKYLEIYDA